MHGEDLFNLKADTRYRKTEKGFFRSRSDGTYEGGWDFSRSIVAENYLNNFEKYFLENLK